MNLKRVYWIDLLKAIAVIFLIVIHVLSNYLDNKDVFFIWNYLHFVVVVFVFSSGYLFAFSLKNNFKDFKNSLLWLKKRLVRLLLSYYFFLSLHYLLWLVFPHFFRGYGLKKGLDFIWGSIFLYGGVDYNWLVLLFVLLAIFSIIIALSLRRKINFLVIFFLSFLIGLFFSFYKFPYQYFKWVMIWPWLMVYCLGIVNYFLERRLKRKSHLIFLNLFLSLTFFIIFYLFFRQKPNLVLFENKYPPNLIYFSYGLGITFFLKLMIYLYWEKIFLLRKITEFLSRNSYNLFFIHYLAMDSVYSFEKNSRLI